MATARIGYYNTGSTPDFGIISADNQRAYVPDALSQTLIFYEMGGRFGRNGASTPVTRMGIGETTNGLATGSPDDLLAYTGTLSPSTQMTYGGDGTTYTASLNTPILGQAGDAFALVLTAANYALGHGMIQQSAYPGKDNYQFYTKANASSTPTNPITGTGSVEGHMALWATGEINVAPNTPTNLVPSGTLVSTDLTPTIQSDFSDSNETLPNAVAYDKLKAFQIQVRRSSDSVSFWDFTGNASASEQSARRVSRSYAGTALVVGTAYQHRHRHQDLAGAWSSWSGWTSFTINSGGTVSTASGTPTGKQNSQAPGPFVGQWSHPSALSTNAAIVRILDSASNVLQTMTQASPYATVVTNGNNISIPWANTGFTNLARGGSGYKYQMQARDSGNAWSPWSASRSFTVNATPSTPTSLSPTGSVVLTAPPKLSLTTSDIDDTTSGLTVTGDILRADGTSVTRTLVWNATTLKFEYQTVVGMNEVQRLTRAGTISGGTFTITVPANVRGAQSTTAAINWNDPAATIQTKLEALANVGTGRVLVTGGPVSTTNVDITFLMELSATDLSQITHTSSLTGGGTLTPSTVTAGVNGDWAGFQTLQWKARAGDGTSTSADSAYSTFIYASGPVVSVTLPTDELTVAVSSYLVTWTVPSGGPQVKYRVQLVEVDGTDTPVVNGTNYDTGDVVSSNLFHQIPSGIYRTAHRYQLTVSVTNGTPLTGSSQPLQINVSYTLPAGVLAFSGTPTALFSATDSDAVLLGWNPTLVPADQFIGYDIWRTALGPAQQASGFLAEEISEDVGVRTRLRRITNPAQINFIDPHPASGVAYLYEIVQIQKVGVDELESASASVTVSVKIPNVVVTVAMEGESTGVELRHKGDKGAYLSSVLQTAKKKVVPVGGRKGRTIASPFLAWADSGTFEIVSDRFMTADQRLRLLNTIIELGVRTLCVRDFTGLKRFVVLDDATIDRFNASHYRAALKFSEEYFEEGE